jgi:hypothetical protein
MKQIHTHWLCISLFISLSTTCLSAKGKNTMTNNNPIKAVCAGRLLIDVPEDATYNIIGKYQAVSEQSLGYGNNFSDLSELAKNRADHLSKEKMEEPVSLFEKSLKAEGKWDRAKTRLIDLQVNTKDAYYMLGLHTKTDSEDFVAELHQLIENKEYEFNNKNSGLSNYVAASDWLISIVKRFEVIKTNAIPTKPGFCVDSGIFVDGGVPEANENFTLTVTFPTHPDVQFSIDANAIDRIDKEEPSLKHRVNSDLAMMRANYSGGVHVIERGALKAAGQKGYQVAISAPDDEAPGATIRKFFWSADGVPNDVTRPFLEVDMTIQPTDDGISTIKSDDEAKALWTQLISSLRIRPGSV